MRDLHRFAAFALFLLASLPHCTDASRMFTGVWKSESALAAGWISGRPDLVIGHFGPELTGIYWNLDEDGLPLDGDACDCAFIEQQDVDLDRRMFIATTELCEDGERWIWELGFDDEGAEPRLFGEVRRAGDEATPPLAVSFRLDDTFVPDDRRECP